MQKFEPVPQETESTSDSPYTMEPCVSIKLFGKTVVVRDTTKQSSEVGGNCESPCHLHINEKQWKFSSGDVVKGLTSNTLGSGNATHPCMQPHTMVDIYGHVENMFALPLYTWYPHPIYEYESETTSENVFKDRQKQIESCLIGNNSESSNFH